MPRPALLTAVSGVLEGPGRHFVPTPRLQRATGIHLLWCSSLLRLWYVAVSRDVHLQYEVLSVSLFAMLPSTYIAHLQSLSSILFVCTGSPYKAICGRPLQSATAGHFPCGPATMCWSY